MKVYRKGTGGTGQPAKAGPEHSCNGANMRMEVNTVLIGSCLSIDRNIRLYERLRETYSRLPIMSHGWDHLHRCLLNAVMIGRTETCDMDIVFPAVLLHDIGFIGNPDPAGHHERGVSACAAWLDDWSEAERKAIADCVYNHKGKAEGFHTIPVTIEQKIICDADLLEKVGYTGLFQSVRTLAELGVTCWPQFRSLGRILGHLMSAEDIGFYTVRARELSDGRSGTVPHLDIYRKAVEELAMYYEMPENSQDRGATGFPDAATEFMNSAAP